MLHPRGSRCLEYALRTERATAAARFRCGPVSQVHGDIRSTSGRLRLYLQLITSPGNQEAALGACVLDGRAHESVESRSRIISPETACETFNTVASSNCSTGAPLGLASRVRVVFLQTRV